MGQLLSCFDEPQPRRRKTRKKKVAAHESKSAVGLSSPRRESKRVASPTPPMSPGSDSKKIKSPTSSGPESKSKFGGERVLFNDLINRGLDPLEQQKTGIGLWYDVMITSERLIIEFDGTQHYTFPNRFHRTRDAFIKAQGNDIRKIKHAVSQGYRIIHIDYSYAAPAKMKAILDVLLPLPHSLIITSREKYSYLLADPAIAKMPMYIHPTP